jgi:L-lactate dehydrogenase complex protein LldE
MKMAELSGAMLETKIDAVRRSGAQVVTGTDVSCLMHLEGAFRRRGLPLRTLHLAQILGGAS